MKRLNPPLAPPCEGGESEQIGHWYGLKGAKGRTLVAAVGGDESSEFIRQSLAITAAWSAAGVAAECVVIPGTNHFTVVDELTRPDSAMVARILDLARA